MYSISVFERAEILKAVEETLAQGGGAAQNVGVQAAALAEKNELNLLQQAYTAQGSFKQGTSEVQVVWTPPPPPQQAHATEDALNLVANHTHRDNYKGIDKCHIQVMLSRQAGNYAAGEHVSGKFVLSVVDPFKIKHAQMVLRCSENARWTSGSGKKKKTHHRARTAHEETVQLMGPAELQVPSTLFGTTALRSLFRQTNIPKYCVSYYWVVKFFFRCLTRAI